ncbi:efflux RND transporter periplasmic adaptor subunit [Alkaliflexus imshenetskii]|uniref:efflux RND transporter periplasmic adaptor subunit n=1 Tax=Alkaliflexus imshenetskii TaxID=286730 RepID=UPI00047E58D6|nr:efflux RND transporter periplasmic adaptor subunit [Alkaliflexus imshenetskii]
MKRVPIILFVAGLLFASFGCGRKAVEEVKQPRIVKVAMPHNGGQIAVSEFNAYIEESLTAEVPFRVGGPVIGLYAEPGDYVKAGAVLATIDPRDFQLRFQAAEAQYNQAKGEYERYLELYNQGKLPANTIDKLETAWLAAKTNWENARNALADTRLTAPFSGHVFQRNINRHETIAPGMPAFTILNMDEVEVVFGIPESMVARMATVQKAVVVVSGISVDAAVKSVAGKSNSNNLFEVRLVMKNPDTQLVRPGMSARVLVNGGAADVTHPSIPVESVFYRQGAPHVWVYDEALGKVASRAISTGALLHGGQIEILSGLETRDKVVVAGTHSLHENQFVRVSSL